LPLNIKNAVIHILDRDSDEPLLNEFDLIVLDNQINARNIEEPVAQFFLQTFLGAELITDVLFVRKMRYTWRNSRIKHSEISRI